MNGFRRTRRQQAQARPSGGIVAQVTAELGAGTPVEECARAHGLPRAFIEQIALHARRRGDLAIVELDRGCVTGGPCTPDPDSIVCAACPLALPRAKRDGPLARMRGTLARRR